jgi:hypothetical protein
LVADALSRKEHVHSAIVVQLWDKSLPYAEFSYNNSYQTSLKMSPFEALYGSKCRTPLYWDQTGERQFFGPELIQEAE